jgi:hypothetical protein
MVRPAHWISGFAGLLICLACSNQPREVGKIVPVKLTVEYESTSTLSKPTQDISKLWQPLYATVETVVTAPIGGTTDSAGAITPSKGLPYDELNRLLIHPRDLVAKGVELFTYKRAFRWLTFNINQNGRPIRTGSIPLDDPKILEIPPIEIDAVEGDILAASVSLLQVDFMSGEDSDSFCRSGAPGFVRTWQGYTEQKVTADVGISIDMKQVETTTLHRSLIAFNMTEAESLKAAEAQQFLVDNSTGMRVEKKLCPVFDLPLNAGNQPDLRFIKAMTFSTPLKGYLLGIESPSFGLKMLPEEAERPDYQGVDFNVAWDLGITFVSIKDLGSEFLLPALPYEKILGGMYEIPATARPLVELDQNPIVEDQKTQVVITWPVAVKALNPVFNLNRIRPFTYSSTGGAAPVCATNLFMDATNQFGKIVLTCTGTGSISVSLDDGFATDEIGIKSYPTGGGISISIGTETNTAPTTGGLTTDVGI